MVQIWEAVRAGISEGADQQLKRDCIDICRPNGKDLLEGADAKRRALSVNSANSCERWLLETLDMHLRVLKDFESMHMLEPDLNTRGRLSMEGSLWGIVQTGHDR